jgi:hypothetical protein
LGAQTLSISGAPAAEVQDATAGQLTVTQVDRLPVLDGALLGVTGLGVQAFSKVKETLADEQKGHINAVLKFVCQNARPQIDNPHQDLAGFYYNLTQGVMTLYLKNGTQKEVDLVQLLKQTTKQVDAGQQELRESVGQFKAALAQLGEIKIKEYKIADVIISSLGRSSLYRAQNLDYSIPGALVKHRQAEALDSVVLSAIGQEPQVAVVEVKKRLKDQRDRLKQLLKSWKTKIETKRRGPGDPAALDRLNQQLQHLEKLESFFLLGPDQDQAQVDSVDTQVAVAVAANSSKPYLDDRDKKSLLDQLQQFFLSQKVKSVWTRFGEAIRNQVIGARLTADDDEKLPAQQLAADTVALLFNADQKGVGRQKYASFCASYGLEPSLSGVADILFTLQSKRLDPDQLSDYFSELYTFLGVDMGELTTPSQAAVTFKQEFEAIYTAQP